jgi:hypothetical protein
MEEERSKRTIYTLSMIRRAAESLPPPGSWRSETYPASIGENGVVEFKRVKLKGKEGRIYRWVYDGKVIVR